jgi:hypothetical protein
VVAGRLVVRYRAIEVDRGVAERGKPGHVGGVERVSAGGEMFKGSLGVDRLPRSGNWTS